MINQNYKEFGFGEGEKGGRRGKGRGGGKKIGLKFEKKMPASTCTSTPLTLHEGLLFLLVMNVAELVKLEKKRVVYTGWEKISLIPFL